MRLPSHDGVAELDDRVLGSTQRLIDQARARHMLLSADEVAAFRRLVAADDPAIYAEEYDVAEIARCDVWSPLLGHMCYSFGVFDPYTSDQEGNDG